MDNLDKLFEQFKEGRLSVREIARINDIPFSTLRDRFRSRYGADYTKHRGDEGSITAVIQEYIDSSSGCNKEIIKSWYESNKNRIHEQSYRDAFESRSRLYTTTKVSRDTFFMCRLSHDLASSPYLYDERYSPQIDEEGAEEWIRELGHAA